MATYSISQVIRRPDLEQEVGISPIVCCFIEYQNVMEYRHNEMFVRSAIKVPYTQWFDLEVKTCKQFLK